MSGSYYNAPTYRDAGCPSQCMSENSYSSLTGKDECSMKDTGDYTIPFSDVSTPSYCNFLDNYSKVGNIYSPSTIYIPPQSAARIYTYPIGVNSDFMVTQPQIVDWKGNTQFNNLTNSPIIQDPAALMKQLEIDINVVEDSAAKLNMLKEQITQIKNMILSAQGTAKIELAVQAIDLAKKADMLYNDIKHKSSSVVTGSQNAAPYTVRDSAKQNKIDSLVARVKMIQRASHAANIDIAIAADLSTNIAKQTANAHSTPEVLKTNKTTPIGAQTMSANTDKGIQPFRYMRRRGY